MCQWGPCRITGKNPTGICGRDQAAVVMANLLRALCAGLAAHARHAHEVYLSIRAAAGGHAAIPLRGAACWTYPPGSVWRQPAAWRSWPSR
jgi:carbon-monoxide dehydrogenase catalytic subunit